MRCLCCGKELSDEVNVSGWHKKCVRNFFGTNNMPEIQIDENTIQMLAVKTAESGFTIPGVQKKLSLHLMEDQQRPRLTLVDYPLGYILKPQVSEYEQLPEAEHLTMQLAESAGIQTVPHALMESADGYAYITRRVDRVCEKDKHTRMMAMEDFCQLDLRLTQDKYKGSYERCAKIIKKYSEQSGLDLTELYLRLVFSFLIGNSDMHLKNFSLIEKEYQSGRYILSPAYDLLPVNLILPTDKEQMALTMNGNKRNLHRNDFLKFAASSGINAKAAERIIDRVCSLEKRFDQTIDDSFLSESMKEQMKELIRERKSVLSGKV